MTDKNTKIPKLGMLQHIRLQHEFNKLFSDSYEGTVSHEKIQTIFTGHTVMQWRLIWNKILSKK